MSAEGQGACSADGVRGDILEGGDIPIFRRLGDLGGIVSSPIVVQPGGRALSANANAFQLILGLRDVFKT